VSRVRARLDGGKKERRGQECTEVEDGICIRIPLFSILNTPRNPKSRPRK
jgi:hypothetical protein